MDNNIACDPVEVEASYESVLTQKEQNSKTRHSESTQQAANLNLTESGLSFRQRRSAIIGTNIRPDVGTSSMRASSMIKI
jgi:hypothetical protein